MLNYIKIIGNDIHICIFVVIIPTTLPIRTAPSGGFSIFKGFDNLQTQAYGI